MDRLDAPGPLQKLPATARSLLTRGLWVFCTVLLAGVVFAECRAEPASGGRPLAGVAERPAGNDSPGGAWPGFRGPRRDGLARWLPESLDRAKILWKKRLTGAGLAGLAATTGRVIVADRDPFDLDDVFRCLDAHNGTPLWKLQYPAPGDLDYGNSPRATPLVVDGNVYLLGAFGDLHCVGLDDGKLIWKTNLVHRFGAKLVTWGMCSSPLVVDGKLIVNPGAPDASLAALDPATGKLLWQTPGEPAAYASFIVGTFGGRRQIVGYDAISLGGWDPATGKRLWQLLPPEEGDFNVPTPVDAGGKLLVTTENNGTRLYEFDPNGTIRPTPVASNRDLAPDTITPLVVDGKVFGCWGDLFCLDSDRLETLWTGRDRAFEDHVSILGAPGRILISTCRGELFLVGTGGSGYELISRFPVFGDDSEVYSHPALVGTRLYLRDGTTVCCVELGPGAPPRQEASR